MRLTASLSLCGCFVAGSRASELKTLSSVSNWTSPSFPTDDASDIFKRALSPHNETEIGKFAIDNTNEEARAFTIEEKIEEITNAVKGLVAEKIKDLQNLLEKPTTEKPNEPLGSDFFEAMDTLQQKSKRTKEETDLLLKHIQQLQDHEEPHFQTTGAASLVDMLRSGTNKRIKIARSVKGKEPAEGSETKWIDQEGVEAWFAYAGKWLNTNVLTLKQAQFFESLFTRLSENEMNDIAEAVVKMDGGKKAIQRLVMFMVAEPLTRERAFRLHVHCGFGRRDLLSILIEYQNQNSASFPLNVWFEFVAYTRFSETFSDPVLRYYELVSINLVAVAKMAKMSQQEIFTKIDEQTFFYVSNPKKKNQPAILFKWIPEHQNEKLRIDNGLVDVADAAAFMTALDNEAVVKAFRAVEVANLDKARTEAQKDPNGVELLSVIIRSVDNFKLFKDALMIRQLKKFAKEFLEFLESSP